MKKQLALLTAVTLVAGMSTSAFAVSTPGEQTAIEKPNDLSSAIYEVDIPTLESVKFSIDPFQKMDETGSQIYSPYFKMVNKSDVPVSVSVKAKIVPATDPADPVVVKASPAEVNSADLTKTDKEIYMEMVAATTVAEDTTKQVKGQVATDPSDVTGATIFDGGVLAAPFTAGTVAAADGTAGPTAAKLTMQLSTTDASDELLKTVGAMEIAITDSNDGDKLVGKIISQTLPADKTSGAIATSFDGATVEIKGETYTAATAADQNVVLESTTTGTEAVAPTGLKFTLQTPTGINGVADVKVTAPVDKYGEDDTGTAIDGANTKGKLALNATDPVEMVFALQKGTYKAPYKVDPETNEPKATTFISLGTDGGAAMRLMGTVNARAAWKASDVNLNLVYDFRGMGSTMYSNVIASKTGTDVESITGLLPLVAAVSGPTLGGVAATAEGATGDLAFDATAMISGTTKLVVPISIPDGITLSLMKISNSAAIAPATTIAVAARPVADGKVTITTTASNITSMKTKGAQVYVEFTDADGVKTKATLRLTV